MSPSVPGSLVVQSPCPSLSSWNIALYEPCFYCYRNWPSPEHQFSGDFPRPSNCVFWAKILCTFYQRRTIICHNKYLPQETLSFKINHLHHLRLHGIRGLSGGRPSGRVIYHERLLFMVELESREEVGGSFEKRKSASILILDAYFSVISGSFGEVHIPKILLTQSSVLY